MCSESRAINRGHRAGGVWINRDDFIVLEDVKVTS
jgi:hypothetical protein